ncbi:ABC transporter permease [Corynebacterium jeikeium]|uniref:ABC transporter permease n=1 Tax=Corynebacterium jeikeium TaxID=38289 RepID=UPI0008866426|nr:ABC transporter permease [Corynebacterium jeikeium]SCX01353.1 acidobacterial duplicated orphan permease [Corynebacterium jeikeium]
MFRISLEQLRRRPYRYLSLFLAIGIAVSLSIATIGLITSIKSSVGRSYSAPYEGIDVVANARGLSADDLATLQGQVSKDRGEMTFERRLPALARADAQPIFERMQLQTLPQSSAFSWRAVREGRLPRNENEVAISPNQSVSGAVNALKVNDTIEVRLQSSEKDTLVDGENKAKVKIVGVLEPDASEQFFGIRSIYSTPALADGLETQGRPADGEIRMKFPDESTEEAIKHLRDLNLEPLEVYPGQTYGDTLADKYVGDRKYYFILLDGFMAVIIIVAALVIFSSYQLITAQRVREYGLLRALGASSGGILRSGIYEAVLLAIAASALAVPIGLWFTGQGAQKAASLGIKLSLESDRVPVWAVALVVAGAIAVTVAACVPSISKTLNNDTLASLRQSRNARMQKSTALVGVLLSSVLVGASIVGLDYLADAAQDGTTSTKRLAASIALGSVLALGAAFLAGVAIPILYRLIGSLVSVSGLKIPFRYAGVQSLRSAALVMIILASSALVVAVGVGQRGVSDHLNDKAETIFTPDVTITPVDGSDVTALAAQIQKDESFGSVVSSWSVAVTAGDQSGDSEPANAIRNTNSEAFNGGGAMLDLKQSIFVGTQSRLRETLKDGEVSKFAVNGKDVNLTVKFTNAQENFIDADTLSENGIDYKTVLESLAITLPRSQGSYGPSLAKTNEQLTTILAKDGREFVIEQGFEVKQTLKNTADRMSSVSIVLIIVSLVITVTACVNSMALAIRERSQDRQLLLAIGVNRFALFRFASLELMILLLPGVIIGALIGGFAAQEILQTMGAG